MIDYEELESRFTYHAPNEAKKALHEDVRELCLSAAVWANSKLPDSREKSVVLTKLEEVMFWANAAIARNDV